MLLFKRPIASVTDKNRNTRVRQHFGGDATEHYRCNPAPAVRCHHNEVAAIVLCGGDYCFVWVILNYLHSLALHPLGLRVIGCRIQY